MAFAPDKCPTVPEWINAGKNLILSRDNTMMKVNQSGTIYPYQSLTTRFGGALNRYIVDYKFDDDVWPDYMFQPKKFCKDYYGTPELWGDILYINHMTSATQFNRQNIKIFTESILDAIGELKAVYANDLTKNQLEVNG